MMMTISMKRPNSSTIMESDEVSAPTLAARISLNRLSISSFRKGELSMSGELCSSSAICGKSPTNRVSVGTNVLDMTANRLLASSTTAATTRPAASPRGIWRASRSAIGLSSSDSSRAMKNMNANSGMSQNSDINAVKAAAMMMEER